MSTGQTDPEIDLKTVYAGLIAGGLAGAILGLICGVAGAYFYHRFNQPQLAAVHVEPRSPVHTPPTFPPPGPTPTVNTSSADRFARDASHSPYALRPYYDPYTSGNTSTPGNDSGPVPAVSPPEMPRGKKPLDFDPPSLADGIEFPPFGSPQPPTRFPDPAATGPLPPRYALPSALDVPPPPNSPAPDDDDKADRDPFQFEGYSILRAVVTIRFHVLRYRDALEPATVVAANHVLFEEGTFQVAPLPEFLGQYQKTMPAIAMRGGNPASFDVEIVNEQHAGQACEGVMEVEYGSLPTRYRFPMPQQARVVSAASKTP